MSEGVTAPSTTTARLQQVAPYARIIMGAVFLVAGAAKVWTPVQFYWDAFSYFELLNTNREMWPQLARFTLLLGPVECGLGLALLANWQPRFVLPVATAAMVVFIAVTFYNWQQEAGVNCGCFGALVERTPAEALVEDAIMFVLLLFAWKWGTTSLPSQWQPAHRLVKTGTILALLIVAIRFYPEVDRIENSDLKKGVRLSGIQLQGADIDLGNGEYLVELFSPGCGRCKKAVPKLNKLAQSLELPRIVALSMYQQDSEIMANFKKLMHPKFDIASISTSDWKRLTWNHGYPRLAFVRDGVVVQVWEWDGMPSLAQIKKVMGKG